MSNTRYMRKSVLLAGTEATYGTAVVVGATDMIVASNVEMTMNPSNKNRDVIYPWLGASEELVGDDYMTISFECELAPSGAAGTAPQWGKLLKGCGMSETVVATTSVEYKPISDTFSSLTLKFNIDGAFFQCTGSRGTFELTMGVGDIPKIKFTFTGLYDGTQGTYSLNPTSTLWKTPEIVTNRNTTGIKLACTYAAGVLTAGTAYDSRGLNSLNIGNSVAYQNMIGTGSEQVVISDRSSTGSVVMNLSAADELLFRTAIRANTTTSMGMEHGSAAGKKVVIYAPSVQRINPKVVNQDGMAMLGMDLRILPTSAGNDEFVIFCK